MKEFVRKNIRVGTKINFCHLHLTLLLNAILILNLTQKYMCECKHRNTK